MLAVLEGPRVLEGATVMHPFRLQKIHPSSAYPI